MRRINKFFNLLKSIGLFLIALLLIKVIKKSEEKFYLIGSNYGEKRGDNSRRLFDYTLEKDKKIYFIENRKLDKFGIKRGSLKSYIYYLNSDIIFYSHSFSDILPEMHKLGWLINKFKGPEKVFIQHGIISLKKIDLYIKSLIPTIDYMIASTQKEVKILKKIGVEEEKIKILGLARYDNFVKTSNLEERILIFLTWGKDYNQKLKEISEVIKKIRKIRKIRIKVITHDMEKRSLKINRLQQEINNGTLLITDDSSVAWDFFYNKKEVIFYKPNHDWYLKDSFLENRIILKEKKLFEVLLKYEYIEKKIKIPNNLFKFKDKNNAKRIYNYFIG